MRPNAIQLQPLLEAAKRQLGLVTLEQAQAAGISGPWITRVVRTGEWVRVFPGVYALSGSAPSWRRDVKAATLWAGPGTVASHRTAARLLGIGNFTGDVIELSGPRNLRCRNPRVLYHRVRELRRRDVTIIDSIPVTNATTTLIQLASLGNPTMLEDLLVDSVSGGLTSLQKLRSELDRPWRGTDGIAELRTVIADAQTYGLAESVFENRLIRALKRGGVDQPVRQFKVWDGQRMVGRIDLAYAKEMLATEADSFRFHSTRRSWSRDRAKNNALAIRGWIFLRVTWEDLRTRPDQVVREIAETLRL